MSRTLLLRVFTPFKDLRLGWSLYQTFLSNQSVCRNIFSLCRTRHFLHHSSSKYGRCFRGYCTTQLDVPSQQDTEDSPSQDAEETNGDASTTSDHLDASNGDETLVSEVKPQRVASGLKYNCSGCGAVLQSTHPKRRGYIVKEKLDEWLRLASNPNKILTGDDEVDHMEIGKDENMMNSEESEEMSMFEGEDAGEDYDSDTEDFFPETFDVSKEESNDVSAFICSRCFALKHYNSALNITLESDDYLKHLSSLKKKRALIILMLDVTDFPCCVFPNLRSLLSHDCSVLIVVNKIDLFPRNLKEKFWSKLRTHVITECKASFGSPRIAGVRFISVTRGIGTTELSEEIVRKWGTRGDIYLMGCTNVGKSSLFNKLLLHLCGSRPGELNADSNLLAPKATISQWPGTTLGLLSFPLMSVGKRRRLLEQQQRREWEIAVGIRGTLSNTTP